MGPWPQWRCHERFAYLAANQALESSPPLLTPLVTTAVNQFRLAGTKYPGYKLQAIKAEMVDVIIRQSTISAILME